MSISTHENPVLAQAAVPRAAFAGTAVEQKLGEGSMVEEHSIGSAATIEGDISEEDQHTLRRVSGKIPWTAYTVAFVELCERFSYYGTTVVFTNFVQRKLPPGSTTGAGHDGQSGALGMGQRASTGFGTFNQFWSYTCPIFGAIIADRYLGRYKTIMYAIAFAVVGHCVLTASAAPATIQHPQTALGVFALGLVILGCGTGGFKSNISPLLAEQQTETRARIETQAGGERVIVDPAVTTQRIFLYFYMCINVGSLVGQIGMVYAEKYVGFWLSFMLPTILFLCCPAVLFFCKKYYVLTPPTGSVVVNFFRLWRLASKGTFSLNPVKTFRAQHSPHFWEKVKPSNIPVSERPSWMTFDDAWVDEVRRGLKACAVFLYMPFYWLAYNQMNNNLTSQAATMQLNGVPNDIIQNLNPISIVLFIPFMDFVVYPALRKARINFTPIKRITAGFFLASAAMIAATVVQVYIYKLSPCGDYANGSTCDPAPLNVWIQTISYVLVGFSEIFASITTLEYAFTKAPTNMRSLVMSVNLFMNAFAAALAQALVYLSDDPYLVWNYAISAIIAFVGGCLFWINWRGLDREEHKLNMLAVSEYRGKEKRNLNVENVTEEPKLRY